MIELGELFSVFATTKHEIMKLKAHSGFAHKMVHRDRSPYAAYLTN